MKGMSAMDFLCRMASDAEPLQYSPFWRCKILHYALQYWVITLCNKYVKKCAADLSEIRPAEREKWLPENHKWYLEVEGLYLDFIENDTLKNDYQLSRSTA